MVVDFSSQEEFAAARETIRRLLRDLCGGQSELVYVALNEAVNNAFFHGYCGQKPMPVQVSILTGDGELEIIVRHEGVGFCGALSAKQMPGDLMKEHGRGLEIIRRCVDQFEHARDGRELILRKKLQCHC